MVHGRHVVFLYPFTCSFDQFFQWDKPSVSSPVFDSNFETRVPTYFHIRQGLFYFILSYLSIYTHIILLMD